MKPLKIGDFQGPTVNLPGVFFPTNPLAKKVETTKNEDLTDLTLKNVDSTIKILRNPWD